MPVARRRLRIVLVRYALVRNSPEQRVKRGCEGRWWVWARNLRIAATGQVADLVAATGRVQAVP